MQKYKLLIIGYARHGKDTVSEFLRDEYDYKFISSSVYCAEHVVIPFLAKRGITYDSVQECYEDRVNHRDKWFEAIEQIEIESPGALTRGILEENNIYCGMRSAIHLGHAKEQGLFDLIIWVDASKRLPPEDSSSNTITPEDADFILDNNGDLEGLHLNIRFMMGRIGDYVEAVRTDID